MWRARGPSGFAAALKFVPFEGKAGETEIRSLKIIRELRHPNLIHVFGAWHVKNYIVIAMELADRTLFDRYEEVVRQGLTGIPRAEMLDYLQQAAKALDYLNQPHHSFGSWAQVGVQHRDIKPQNLLLVGGGIKVADLGLARLLYDTSASHTGSMTLLYAAPEFFDGKTTQWSDQYSLAVTYCMLRTGRAPFTGSPAEIMAGHMTRLPDLSMLEQEERSVVARALAKKPDQRWPNCLEFVSAFNLQVYTPHRTTEKKLTPKTQIAAESSSSQAVVDEARQEPPRTKKLKRRQPEKKKTSGPVWKRSTLWVAMGVLVLVVIAGIVTHSYFRPNTEKIESPVKENARDANAPSKQPDNGISPTISTDIKPLNPPDPLQEMTNSIGMKFTWIPPGSFTMGSPPNEKERNPDETQHRVALTKGFWMGVYLVTQAQWQAVMKNNPSYFKGEDRPVESISWEDCQEYCRKLSAQEHKTYRLPTEAEWEYACRAGTTTAYCFGDEDDRLGDYAWFRGNSGSQTHPVGQKKPNAWGFTICMATSGNSVRTGREYIPSRTRWTLRGLRRAPTGCVGAAVGTTNHGAVGQRTGAMEGGTCRVGTLTWAVVSSWFRQANRKKKVLQRQ